MLGSTDEGVHTPVIPFVEVPCKEGTGTPEKMVIDVPKLKVGIIFCDTVTASVAVVAHNPGAGVKV